MFTKALLDKNFQSGAAGGQINPATGKFLLITSATHERRALKCFEKAGIHATPLSVDRYSGPRSFEFDRMFIPNAKILFNWEALTHEIIGLWIYKVAGYV